MKTIIISALMAVAAYAQSATWAWPRQDTSCSNAAGWFWDGQKCENCVYNCNSCQQWNTCSKCQDGYGQATSADQMTNVCLPCATNSNPNGVQSCCIQGNFSVITNSTAATQFTTIPDGLFFQATSCMTNSTNPTGPFYNQIGGYCFIIQGCQQYTQYGRCMQCIDGYYLDQDGMCTKCWTVGWDDAQSTSVNQNLWDMPYVNASQYLWVSSPANNGCKTCNGPNQCDTCQPGWYMASNAKRDTNDLTTARSPSMCRKCNDGCLCSDFTNLCSSCQSAGMYYDPWNQNCKMCNDTSNGGIAGCTSCAWDSNNKLQCLTCQSMGYASLAVQNATQYVQCIPCAGKGTGASPSDIPGDAACQQCYIANFVNPSTNVNYTWLNCNDDTNVNGAGCPNGYASKVYTDAKSPNDMSKNIFPGVDTNGASQIKCINCVDAITAQEGTNQNNALYAYRCKNTGPNVFQITQCGPQIPSTYTYPMVSTIASNDNVFPKLFNQRAPTSNYHWGYSGANSNPLLSQEVNLVTTSNNMTMSCIPNQYNCKQIAGNSSVSESMLRKNPTCASCYDGYFLLANGTCTTCTSVFSSVTGCVQCGMGSGPNTLTCVQCVDGRQTPINSTTLMQNYDVNPSSTGSCTACTSGCLTCPGGKCSVCQQGYRLNSDGSCQKCATGINNCINCDDSVNTCKQCMTGYRLVTTNLPSNNQQSITACETCDAYCSNCDGDRKVCTQCWPGYYLQNGVCQPKRNGCVVYDASNGICSACQYGMRLVNGWCLKCFDQNGGFYDCPQNCGFSDFPSGATNIRDPNSSGQPANKTSSSSTSSGKRNLLALFEDN